MVRNTKGGKGSKGLARKLVNNETSIKSYIRRPENELEVFALTTKMFGNMCEVVTCDGKTFKCHIRGKFKGKSKRNCIISVGKVLMVGFREFEAPNFKVCDLLEVYEPNEVNELQKIPGVNIQSLIAQSIAMDFGSSSSKPTGDNLFEFSNEDVDEEPKNVLIKHQDTPKIGSDDDDQDEIDIDDI
jgi:translation initiation factor IF-1